MVKKSRLTKPSWPLLLLLSGCSGQPAIAPGGVVSNNPCIDAVLAEIAAPGQIAAVSVYSHDASAASAPLDWARGIPAIGTSAEDVILARPKLLLTGNLSVSGTNAVLAKAGVRLEAFGVPVSVAENVAQVRAIAAAIGRRGAGEDLVRQIDRAAVPSGNIGPRPSAIIWQAGGFVAGQGTLQDELLSRAGFTNASAKYGLNQWSQLPLESLVRNPPDVIFMPVKAGGDEGRELAMRTRLLGYVPKTRVVDFPDRLLFCGGPTIIAAMDVMRSAKGGS
jgi:iron complex transport system substrate-binding protein